LSPAEFEKVAENCEMDEKKFADRKKELESISDYLIKKYS